MNYPIRQVAHALAVGFLLMLALLPKASAQAQQYGDVDISPGSQSAAPGEFVTFIVSGGSSHGGTLIINIDPFLTVSGDVVCLTGCVSPEVTVRSDLTVVEVNIVGTGAAVQLTLMVNASAQPGSTLVLDSTLVGGPKAVYMASALVTVLPASSRSTSSSSDNYAYLVLSPGAARVAPEGTVPYFVQPIFWGDWAIPDFTVEITIPAGAEIVEGPFCGERLAEAPRTDCDLEKTKTRSGRTIYSVISESSGGNADGVYFTLKPDEEVEAGEVLKLDATLHIPSDPGSVQGGQISSSIRAVDARDLEASASTSSSLGALIEVRSQYEVSPSGCSAPNLDEGRTVYLRPWGSSENVSEATVSRSWVDTSTNSDGEESCFFEIAFEGRFRDDLYILSTGDCRAYNLGIVTIGQDADIVIVQE